MSMNAHPINSRVMNATTHDRRSTRSVVAREISARLPSLANSLVNRFVVAVAGWLSCTADARASIAPLPEQDAPPSSPPAIAAPPTIAALPTPTPTPMRIKHTVSSINVRTTPSSALCATRAAVASQFRTGAPSPSPVPVPPLESFPLPSCPYPVPFAQVSDFLSTISLRWVFNRTASLSFSVVVKSTSSSPTSPKAFVVEVSASIPNSTFSTVCPYIPSYAAGVIGFPFDVPHAASLASVLSNKLGWSQYDPSREVSVMSRQFKSHSKSTRACFCKKFCRKRRTPLVAVKGCQFFRCSVGCAAKACGVIPANRGRTTLTRGG
mmetsp:Transcript_5949/g.19792  ORF Transcript_5949/g.19792 Transcript_5949/m.19792 type:complete len:323 (-) Transcript_5949:1264-2232(-)